MGIFVLADANMRRSLFHNSGVIGIGVEKKVASFSLQ